MLLVPLLPVVAAADVPLWDGDEAGPVVDALLGPAAPPPVFGSSLVRGGRQFFPETNGALRPVAFASFGVGVDHAR